jgi:TfoX/Sxy family transcriptional regulator of competence genes
VTTPAPSPYDILARRVRELLTGNHDVREVRMFGGLSYMVDERLAVAVRRGGELLVRTDPAEYDDLLQRGAVPAHMGDERPMGRGWLTVPYQQIQNETELAYWINVGIDSRNAPR